MSELPVGAEPGKRGEAAWKELTTRVAERNRQARAAGKQQRATYERARAQSRKAEERRSMNELLRGHPRAEPPRPDA